MAEVLICVAALVAGVTGAWSPCGFSMVETLAPRGYAGSRPVSVLACGTFAVGALAGGVVTFAGLALVGSALGAAAPAAAAVVALVAAVGEARGARIVPQVRRQVPESWRRVLPVPVAAAGYGVLLGLGFTTFILTFAVWALAGIALALGDPALGLLAGLAFGAGRALPVVALAPSGGGSVAAAMAEQPRILRALRSLDAVALCACALALLLGPATASAQAASSVAADGASDPSLDGATLAVNRPGLPGALITPNGLFDAAGTHPAVGGGRSAWLAGDAVLVAGAPPIAAPGVNAVAVSAGWVAWRVGRALWAQPTGGAARRVVAGTVSRPALDGATLVYSRRGRIEAVDLGTGARTILRAERGVDLRGPSAAGGRLAYVRASFKRQQLRVGALAATPRGTTRGDRVLYSTLPTGRRDAGYEPGHGRAEGHEHDRTPRPPAGLAITLTTTAVGPAVAYVTELRQLRKQAATTRVVAAAG